MAIQIDGDAQTAQEQTRLDNLQQQIDGFVRASRRVTDQITELLRAYQALNVGDDIGAASGGEYLTASSESRTVEDVRTELKAACSYAVIVGELTQAEADAILQEAFGNSTETTVSGDQIKSLTDQWV